MTLSFSETLARLVARELDAEGVGAAFGEILAGAWTPVQVGAFAVALRMRGETPGEIVAAARAMRAVMSAVDHDLPVVADTCGTGGDGAHTLNISSAAAIVVASAGVPVAKHGNRSVSSRCGSADVVEALGVPLDVPPERQHEVLREVGIAFLFAPAHHPALRHAAQARRELGLRTLFNALGPLANPARATHQLVGVYDDGLRAATATSLGSLGVKRAWVVRGEDGLDEVSPCGPTRVSVLDEGGAVTERVVRPEDFGVAPLAPSALAGGDARDNADAVRAILEGARHAARDAVLINAAAALAIVSGGGLPESLDRARRAIDEGAAARKLEAWREAAARRSPRAEGEGTKGAP